MTELTDEQIEEAFAEIRAKFEKRNNGTGIEILDGYEEQWYATGSLSDRQNAWLERQLNETWRGTGADRRPIAETKDTSQHEDEADLLDAIIEQRLAANGKRLVDDDQIARLKKAVNDLDAVLDGFNA